MSKLTPTTYLNPIPEQLFSPIIQPQRVLKNLWGLRHYPSSILPLVIFRIGFGLLMFGSTVRFINNGWVTAFYLEPDFHFKYYGFEWVEPIWGLLWVFWAIAGLSLLITVGLLYRFSIISFFILFTYTELLDKTYYLNHYYFISLLSFLLIFLPLNRAYAIDCWLWPRLKTELVPRWTIATIQLQLSIVYIFAGIAKLQPDWLFHALPLRIWLKGHTNLPLIGGLMELDATAYLMSWGGAIYDLTIPFWLLYRPTRPWAYLAVIIFHLMTGWLFLIGVFPYVMIICTLIFFSAEDWHTLTGWRIPAPNLKGLRSPPTPSLSKIILTIFFIYQLLFPLRHWLYPGNLLWTEEGYRFAWHVMAVEKTGQVIFQVTDPVTNQHWNVYPKTHLTYQQEKQMSFQPDMILELAHYLEEQIGRDVEIRAEAWVSLNGRASRLLIDPTVDLTQEEEGWQAKTWVLH